MDFLEIDVMDDSRTAQAQNLNWSDPDHLSYSPPAKPNVDAPSFPEPAVKTPVSTDEKALDRWFNEQRGGRRIPKRLDVANELLVTAGGPLKMTGNITLIDEEGSVTHSNSLSLCRCGASKSKPICDDQHLEVEFFDGGAIGQLSDWMPVSRPQTITVTAVKNGPLKFRGYLRIYNKKGQECITMNGALCRCGNSSKKPFCDSKQKCNGC